MPPELAAYVWPALIVAGTSIVTLLVGRELQRAQSRKAFSEAEGNEATAAKTITETSLSLLNEMRKETDRMRKQFETDIQDLQAELKAVHKEISYYRKGVNVLVRQLRANNIEPEFVPDAAKVFNE